MMRAILKNVDGMEGIAVVIMLKYISMGTIPLVLIVNVEKIIDGMTIHAKNLENSYVKKRIQVS